MKNSAKFRVIEIPMNYFGDGSNFIIQRLEKLKWWKKAQWVSNHQCRCSSLMEAQECVEKMKRDFVVWESE